MDFKFFDDGIHFPRRGNEGRLPDRVDGLDQWIWTLQLIQETDASRTGIEVPLKRTELSQIEPPRSQLFEDGYVRAFIL